MSKKNDHAKPVNPFASAGLDYKRCEVTPLISVPVHQIKNRQRDSALNLISSSNFLLRPEDKFWRINLGDKDIFIQFKYTEVVNGARFPKQDMQLEEDGSGNLLLTPGKNFYFPSKNSKPSGAAKNPKADAAAGLTETEELRR